MQIEQYNAAAVAVLAAGSGDNFIVGNYLSLFPDQALRVRWAAAFAYSNSILMQAVGLFVGIQLRDAAAHTALLPMVSSETPSPLGVVPGLWVRSSEGMVLTPADAWLLPNFAKPVVAAPYAAVSANNTDAVNPHNLNLYVQWAYEWVQAPVGQHDP